MSGRVAVTNEGRIEQEGAPEEIYDNPATAFVGEFLRDIHLFHGRGAAERGGEGKQKLIPAWTRF